MKHHQKQCIGSHVNISVIYIVHLARNILQQHQHRDITMVYLCK